MTKRAWFALAGMLLLLLAACAPGASEQPETGDAATPVVKVYRSPS
jgi:outer membrane biogenesis lipoprotein LolB